MSTDCFLNAMGRFESLRGRPSQYQSDNGTNFTGARNELNECWSSLDQDIITSQLAGRRIKWKFNPPSAPHMGGAWEALVRSAKRALHFVLDGLTLDDETFTTAVAHAAGLLNSRPLTVLTEDPANPEPLTPNHLLLGRANSLPPPDVFSEREISSKKRWRAAQAVADLFWRRWIDEFVPTMMERRKWIVNDHNLCADDVVAVLDRKNSRGQWVIGTISRPLAGSDGIVRSAWVRIPNPGGPEETTEIHRPSTRLALLEPFEKDSEKDSEACLTPVADPA